MAKIPKFNLTMDGELVRSIEELQNNFSVDDILEHFESKRLHKWLKSRGFTDYLTEVEAIQSTDKGDIIKELMDLFDIDYSQDDLADIRSQLNYTPRQSTDSPNVTVKSKQGDETTSNLSDSFNLDYEHQKYTDLVNEIINDPENLELVKNNIETIASKYYSFLSLDALCLLRKVSKVSPVPIYVILDNPKAFQAYMPSFIINKTDPLASKVDGMGFLISMSTALRADILAEFYRLFPHIKKIQNVEYFKIDNPVLILFKSDYERFDSNTCNFMEIKFAKSLKLDNFQNGILYYLDLADYNIPKDCFKLNYNNSTELDQLRILLAPFVHNGL